MERTVSKGSARRPGSGYADGWSRIYGGKDAEQHQAEQGAKNQDLRKLLDSLPTKTFTLVYPLIGGTCGECKHWIDGRAMVNHCNLLTDSSMCDETFVPPASFGCNRFERKV